MPIRLDRALYENIREEATKRGIPMSHVIRERLGGSRSESTPVDVASVRAIIKEILVNDPEVAEALKVKA